MNYENNKIVYEVGDWVTVSKRPATWSSHFNRNCPFKIGDFPVTFPITKIAPQGVEGMNYGWSANTEFSPATQEEIDKALKIDKIFIGEYEVKFSDIFNNKCIEIYVGCQTVTKEIFLKIGEKAKWI